MDKDAIITEILMFFIRVAIIIGLIGFLVVVGAAVMMLSLAWA